MSAAPKPERDDGLVEAPVGLQVMDSNMTSRRARLHRPRWNPKQWHPVYEEIVLLDALGYKNYVIAEQKGFTKEHISNILCTPQAKMIKQIILARMEKKREETFDERIERISIKAMDRVEAVINDDTLFEKNPLSIFDRAIVTLKAAKKIEKEDAAKITNNIMLNDEMAKKLISAVTKSDEVRALHAGKQSIEIRGDVVK